MNRILIARATCIFILLQAILWPVLTGAEIDQSSYKICGKLRDSSHAWSWENVQKHYAGELRNGKYQKIYQDLVNTLGTSTLQRDREIQKKFLAKLEDVSEHKGNGRLLFDIQVVMPQDLREKKKYYLFKDDPAQIDFQDCETNGELAEQLDELRDFAHAIVNLSDLETSPERQKAVEHIHKLETLYDRYLFEGYPMFPWEAAVNGFFLTNESIDAGPPRNQMIFFHLGVGFEVCTESMAKSELGTAVSLEPLGWINYPVSKEFRTWWGIAALTTFRQDMGMGAGVALHYNEFSLGVIWHEKDEPGTHFGKPYVFLGIDLYRYLDKSKRQYDQYVGKYNALKEQYLPVH